MKKNYGFTLIEVLVVIAIIGVLSTVILNASNSARVKAYDASIKANLDSIKTSAEFFHDQYGNYGVINGGTCFTDELFSYEPILNAITSAESSSGTSALCVTGYTGSLDTIATSWALSIALRSDATKYWCIDSNGVSKIGTESRDSNNKAYCS